MSEKIEEQRNDEMADNNNNEIAEKMKMLEASIFAIEKNLVKVQLCVWEQNRLLP